MSDGRRKLQILVGLGSLTWLAACRPVKGTTSEQLAAVPPRPEPLTLRLEDWWASAAAETTTANGRHVELTSPSGACTVLIDRWWGFPPEPGGPAHQESSRPVVVDGIPFSLSTFSLFDGVAQNVDALLIHWPSVTVRIVFRACTPLEVDAVLAKIEFSPSLKASVGR
jgi:hypothetical protein